MLITNENLQVEIPAIRTKSALLSASASPDKPEFLQNWSASSKLNLMRVFTRQNFPPDGSGNNPILQADKT